MELTEWLAGITNDDAQEIAERAGIPKRTVQHQIKTGRMSIENIVKIAAAYGHHPVSTLIDWEVIGPEWQDLPDIRAALRLASEDDLGEEVLRRMKLGVPTVGDLTVDDLAERHLRVADSSPDEDALRGYDDDDHLP